MLGRVNLGPREPGRSQQGRAMVPLSSLTLFSRAVDFFHSSKGGFSKIFYSSERGGFGKDRPVALSQCRTKMSIMVSNAGKSSLTFKEEKDVFVDGTYASFDGTSIFTVTFHIVPADLSDANRLGKTISGLMEGYFDGKRPYAGEIDGWRGVERALQQSLNI